MSTREPLAIRGALVALVAAIVNLVVAFGVNLNAEQVGAINAVVGLAATAVVVVWSRGSVTPVDDPRDAEGNALVSEDSDYYSGFLHIRPSSTGLRSSVVSPGQRPSSTSRAEPYE